MRFHHNTTPAETVAYLRDQAIGAKQPPAVIDALDELRDLLELPNEVETLEAQVTELEGDRDDLRGELSDLVEQMQLACDILESVHDKPAEAATFFDFGDLKAISRQLDFAKKALERYKTK